MKKNLLDALVSPCLFSSAALWKNESSELVNLVPSIITPEKIEK